MPYIYLEDKNVQTLIQEKFQAGYPGIELQLDRSFLFFPDITTNRRGTCLAWSSCFTKAFTVRSWVKGDRNRS